MDRLFPVSDLDPVCWEADSAKVPGELVKALNRYFNRRIETGSFLRAVLENDLRGAVAKGDGYSVLALIRIVRLLIDYAPSHAWGSPEAVAAWLAVPSDDLAASAVIGPTKEDLE